MVRRTAFLQIRLTPADRERIDQAAAAEHLDSSTWARRSGRRDGGVTTDGKLPGDGAARDAVVADSKPRPPASWKAGPPLSQARSHHSATLLQDDTVLVVGGINKTALASAEIYNPKSNSWSAAGSMSQPHWDHTATLLKDGRVLIVGGCKEGSSFVCMIDVTAEVYDPKAAAGSRWKKVNSMSSDRRAHAATLLDDGRVLVVGGFNNRADLTSLEIWNPKSGFWSTPSATMPKPRNRGTVTALKTGKVLLAGGFTGNEHLNTLALFDPKQGTLTPLKTTLKEARSNHSATLLKDGRVLFTGGFCDTRTNTSCVVKSSEIYDPATDKVVPAGSPGTKVYNHSSTLLQSGNVLVVGGRIDSSLTRVYLPSGSAWSQTAKMPNKHQNHTATRLPDGNVLVTGGDPNSSWQGTTTVDIYVW